MGMKAVYKKAEDIFEMVARGALKVFGSSITFLLALLLVIIFLSTTPFNRQSLHDSIYSIILSFTFLGFFIIQKSFNKFNATLNLKLNELVSSHEFASNRLVNIENKSEAEMKELTKQYAEIAEESKKSGELNSTRSIEHKLGKGNNDETKKKGK